MMWLTEFCSVADVGTGVGVGVADGAGEGEGVGVGVGPPAETPPPQPESESKKTKQTREHDNLFIGRHHLTLNQSDVITRAAGCPELLLNSLRDASTPGTAGRSLWKYCFPLRSYV